MMDFKKISAINRKTRNVSVVIDTPKWSRNKFSWNETLKVFEMSGVLPTGAQFPYDFGFIPHTRGGDGDPLDVLVMMDEPAFTGCLVETRLIGVIEAEQTEQGQTMRNDRLIGVAINSRTETNLRALDDLNATLLDQIEHFFVSYNAAKGKKFVPLRRSGPERARKLVQASLRAPSRARKHQ